MKLKKTCFLLIVDRCKQTGSPLKKITKTSLRVTGCYKLVYKMSPNSIVLFVTHTHT